MIIHVAEFSHAGAELQDELLMAREVAAVLRGNKRELLLDLIDGFPGQAVVDTNFHLGCQW